MSFDTPASTSDAAGGTPHALAGSAQDILAKLVSFDTVSRNSNLDLIAWVESYLGEHGIESTRIPDETGEKASLFATIGPADTPGVGLSGHTDVVPVDGQDWDTDPFSLIEADGKLYGRGACDMKGYLACVLAAVPMFAKRELKVPVHIVFSYDEEIGCIGVLPMIEKFGEDFVTPRVVFVGEPTEMTVVDAHKGPCRWIVKLRGKAVHSSLAHQGVNTITYATRLISELDRMEQAFMAEPNDRFDPPYTTLQVTQLEAGRASNIVPEDCWFGWEIRGLPGVSADDVEARVRAVADRLTEDMRKVDPDAGIELIRSHSVPPFQADPDREALPLALRLAETNETFAVAYATEASHFEVRGIPTVVCGPGNIAQAHTPNEWLAKLELSKCLWFFDRLGDWCETQA